MKKVLVFFLFVLVGSVYGANEEARHLTTAEQVCLNDQVTELLNQPASRENEAQVLVLFGQGADPKNIRVDVGMGVTEGVFSAAVRHGYSKIIQHLYNENLWPSDEEIQKMLILLRALKRFKSATSGHLDVERILQEYLAPIPPK